MREGRRRGRRCTGWLECDVGRRCGKTAFIFGLRRGCTVEERLVGSCILTVGRKMHSLGCDASLARRRGKVVTSVGTASLQSEM